MAHLMASNLSGEHHTTTEDQQSLGKLLKELRQVRQLSRSKVLHRYHQELEQVKPEYEDSELRSEAWLARVERNEVYVSSLTLELLCRSLDCNERERAQLLKCADRIPFVTPVGQTTVVADVLTLAMVCLYHDPHVREMIEVLMEDRRVFTLEKDELFAIISDVLDIAKPTRRELSRPYKLLEQPLERRLVRKGKP